MVSNLPTDINFIKETLSRPLVTAKFVVQYLFFTVLPYLQRLKIGKILSRSSVSKIGVDIVTTNDKSLNSIVSGNLFFSDNSPWRFLP